MKILENTMTHSNSPQGKKKMENKTARKLKKRNNKMQKPI